MPVSNMPFHHPREEILAAAAGLPLWACMAGAHMLVGVSRAQVTG
jgi:hypothetical protein